MFRLTKKLVLVVAVVAAFGVAGTVALASRSLTARNHSSAQPRVGEDAASIARHRALGRLGQTRVYHDPVVVARHRALGRLQVQAERPSRMSKADGNRSEGGIS